MMQTMANTSTGKHILVLSSAFSSPHPITFRHLDNDSDDHELKVSLQVEKSNKYHFCLITVMMSDLHHDDPLN